MFGLFKKKDTPVTVTYESIAVDMHSHVLPGIDDGAQTPEESIVLIKKMMELGIKKIIATPHVMADYYKNTPETIGNALNILKAELINQNINIEVEAAAEHYFDETFEARVDNRKLLTMGDNYALFEFSFINQPPNAVEVIMKMKELGYRPILAHPERYVYMDIEQLQNIRSWGCNLQLNTISLTGYFGKDAFNSLILSICIFLIASSTLKTFSAGASCCTKRFTPTITFSPLSISFWYW